MRNYQAPSLYFTDIPGNFVNFLYSSSIVNILDYVGMKNFNLFPSLYSAQAFLVSFLPNFVYSYVVEPITGMTNESHFDHDRLQVILANNPGNSVLIHF